MVLLLTSLTEINQANLSKTDLIISFVVSIFILCSWLLVTIASLVYIKIISKPDYNHETSFFREFHEGLKSTPLGNFYMPAFLIRRLIWVAWVVFASNMNPYVRIGSYSLFQIIALVYTWVSRPFADIWDNVIEILNDFAYAVLWWVLIVFNRQEYWKDYQSNAIIIFMWSNAIIVISIEFIVMIVSIYKNWASIMKRKRSVVQITSMDMTMVGNDVSQNNLNNKRSKEAKVKGNHDFSHSRNIELSEAPTRARKFTSNEIEMIDEDQN